jgi:hypothetical protein
MRKRILRLWGGRARVVGLASSGWALEPTKDYLAATWGVGGADACDAATTEQITFDPAGTFTTTSGGKATAAGFWHLVLDNLDLRMVTSPAFFDPISASDEALSEFAGQHNYFYAKALISMSSKTAFAPSLPWATCCVEATIAVAHDGGLQAGR